MSALHHLQGAVHARHDDVLGRRHRQGSKNRNELHVKCRVVVRSCQTKTTITRAPGGAAAAPARGTTGPSRGAWGRGVRGGGVIPCTSTVAGAATPTRTGRGFGIAGGGCGGKRRGTLPPANVIDHPIDYTSSNDESEIGSGGIGGIGGGGGGGVDMGTDDADSSYAWEESPRWMDDAGLGGVASRMAAVIYEHDELRRQRGEGGREHAPLEAPLEAPLAGPLAGPLAAPLVVSLTTDEHREERGVSSSAADAQEEAEGKVEEEEEEEEMGWAGYRALFAQIAVLGLPALVNSCIEPVLSSAETACAAKIGTLYIAALAPSSSLFAFAAEICFAVSVVVTTAIAKVSVRATPTPRSKASVDAGRGGNDGGSDGGDGKGVAGGGVGAGPVEAGEAQGRQHAVASAAAAGAEVGVVADGEATADELPRTITAAVTASFVSGAVLAGAFALLAGPLLRVMHVPTEVAPLVKLYVGVRAMGLPFFAASNAAEGVFVGQRDGVTPMVAWTCTGAATLAMLLAAARPSALGLGLPGAAAAIALGQVMTAGFFARGLVKRGWLIWPLHGVTAAATGATFGSSSFAAGVAAGAAVCREAVDVLVRTRMLNEIGWMFLGAFSRMGTYAAVTASASALGVIPGATHKVALETYWLLSFFTEPIFTACNALLPRELAAGRYKSARTLRKTLVALAAALGMLLSAAGATMTSLAVYSDDPLVTAALSALVMPVAVTLGLAATTYGVEGTIIGAGEVGYLGRTHARDFFVVLCLLKLNERVAFAGGGLAGIWWVLAAFQGLRICQHWVHLSITRPFREDGKKRQTANVRPDAATVTAA